MKQIALQIVNALESAHEKGIVHLDLKPARLASRFNSQGVLVME